MRFVIPSYFGTLYDARMLTRKTPRAPFLVDSIARTVQDNIIFTGVCYPCLISHFPHCKQMLPPQILAQSYY